ncbi:response regulator [Endothiovibrio diazotrophicus]
MNNTILIIEDEPHIRQFLRISLEAHGFQVEEARLGEEGLRRCTEAPPALVILDLGLPDMDGQQVLLRLREWSRVPILVLSVRADEAEKVAALDHGADDYVTKPFGIGELMARIRVSLRTHGDEPVPPVHRCGALSVDLADRRVILDGDEVHLTRKEFSLLGLLIRNPGKVLTHQQILREVWGEAYSTETHYLRVLMGQLRQKLGDSPSHPRFIATEQGIGYRLRCR